MARICKNSLSISSLVCLCALLSLVALPTPAFSGSAVPSLPGFPGPLPFTLETGYISVGDIEFFYYFVQSDSNPRADPILLYLNGGPGCSGFNGFIYQIGPLKFNVTDYEGGLPTLIYEPNTWSKTANLLFLDAPVGAGFSYATTDEAYYTTDTMNAKQIHHFLRNWLSEHPKFITNRVYLGSDSYAGLIIPMLATDIIDGNAAGLEPQIRLEGYSLGCPHTFTDLETNSRIDYAHRLTLISDGLYESAKNSCGGNYVTSTSANCTVDLAAITECIQLINRQNILEPNCAFTKPESNLAFQLSPNQDKHRRALQQLTKDYIRSNSDLPDLWCKNIDYLLSDFWLNDADVQTALHIRNGTKGEVYRCNATLSGYTVDIDNVVAYHQNLTAIGMQILVFSGDHDMMIPHIAIETWIKYLGLDIDSDWRPWFVDGQVAGYTRKYTDTGYRLTYATLKGSGHSPPEYKRKECYHMFDRWVHYYPLYTSVGEIEFFYYLIESESNPSADHVLVYLNGGPGCSAINGFFYQAGPLKFNITDYFGGLPTLLYEPNTWSKTANLLFLDAPIGAGFSYAKTSAAYDTSDTLTAQQVHLFLRKWLSDHPRFLLNRVFIGSDSYAGIVVPMLATNIINGNEAGVKPHIRLEGYIMGCAHTNTILEINSRIPYAHRLTLISDSLYEDW